MNRWTKVGCVLLLLSAGLGCGSGGGGAGNGPGSNPDARSTGDSAARSDVVGQQDQALPMDLPAPEVEVLTCAEACAGWQCGDAGGCACGSCAYPAECNVSTHLCECLPTCQDPFTGEQYECGDDGCGDVCGVCSRNGGQWRDPECKDHKCQCVPDCTGRVCGFDGCEGTCGDCGFAEGCSPDGKHCIGSDCYYPYGFPDLAWAQKIVTIAWGNGAHPGEALDVDANPDTCAPPGDCEAGLDNALSATGLDQLTPLLAGTSFDAALSSGKLVPLLVAADFSAGCKPFQLDVWPAAPVDPKETCDFQQAVCGYDLRFDMWDFWACHEGVALGESLVCDGKLKAGAPDNKGLLTLRAVEGANPSILLRGLRMAGDVVQSGDLLVIENGIFAAAILEDSLLYLIDVLSTSDSQKNALVSAVLAVAPDIDTDDDGVPDSYSFSLKFSTIPAKLSGEWKEDPNE